MRICIVGVVGAIGTAKVLQVTVYVHFVLKVEVHPWVIAGFHRIHQGAGDHKVRTSALHQIHPQRVSVGSRGEIGDGEIVGIAFKHTVGNGLFSHCFGFGGVHISDADRHTEFEGVGKLSPGVSIATIDQVCTTHSTVTTQLGDGSIQAGDSCIIHSRVIVVAGSYIIAESFAVRDVAEDVHEHVQRKDLDHFAHCDLVVFLGSGQVCISFNELLGIAGVAHDFSVEGVPCRTIHITLHQLVVGLVCVGGLSPLLGPEAEVVLVHVSTGHKVHQGDGGIGKQRSGGNSFRVLLVLVQEGEVLASRQEESCGCKYEYSFHVLRKFGGSQRQDQTLVMNPGTGFQVEKLRITASDQC